MGSVPLLLSLLVCLPVAVCDGGEGGLCSEAAIKYFKGIFYHHRCSIKRFHGLHHYQPGKKKRISVSVCLSVSPLPTPSPPISLVLFSLSLPALSFFFFKVLSPLSLSPLCLPLPPFYYSLSLSLSPLPPPPSSLSMLADCQQRASAKASHHSLSHHLSGSDQNRSMRASSVGLTTRSIARRSGTSPELSADLVSQHSPSV